MKTSLFGPGDVVFSPDGRRLATACARMVKVWDAKTGRELLTIKGPTTGNVMAFYPDGRRLATACSDGSMKVWDARNSLESLTPRDRT